MDEGSKAASIMNRICLHGPESTGKSTLATRLAAHFGCEVVPEYGRAYCEEHGTNIDMAALVHIAQTQDAMNQAAAQRSKARVLFDTDPLVTTVWAEMMFENRDMYFSRFDAYADLYLLLDIDLPFIDDGLRVYREPAQRQHFFDLCKAELEVRGVKWALVQGEGEARFQSALRHIEEVLR
jgi:NadR type nicotinamide-nucleotide adenylyltransferase